MDQKDKIDLSSVNKTKKQFKLTNPFKKNTAGPGRDQFGQFASGGSGLRGKSKWMNWKVLAIAVVLVGVVGGFYVYKSNATEYTFTKYPSQMRGGQLVTKSGGASYRVAAPREDVFATLSKSEISRTGYFCTHFTLSQDSDISINVGQEIGSQAIKGGRYTKGKHYLCVRKPPNVDQIDRVGVFVQSGSTVYVDTFYGKPGTRSADASCKISTAQATNGTYTATWNSGGIDLSAAEEPLTMRLKNSATGTETPDLPLAGSRALAPKAGANNVYTMTLYEGTEATDLTCSTSVNLSPTTPPPATTPSCELRIDKSGTSYTASWLSSGIPAGSNWGSALSRPGGNTALGATTGSAAIVPPTGTTTYTLVIYDKNISSTGAMNSWKATCAANVTK